MQTVIKRKIFGALLILAILAVVAVVLINRTTVNPTIVSRQIPLPPPRANTVTSNQANSNNVATVSKSSAAASSVASRPAVTAQTSNSLAAKNSSSMQLTQLNNALPVKRWALQVASFSQQQNANILLDRLQNANFSAYINAKNNNAGQSLYTVMIGPEVNKNAFKQITSNLLKQFDLQPGAIKSYSRNT
jgi:DedD protein